MSDRVQWYQEIIGSLLWSIEIGRIDLLFQVAVMFKHIDLHIEGHIEQFLNTMGYMKNHNKIRLIFDSINPNMKESWFK